MAEVWKRGHDETCPMAYMYGECTCGYAQQQADPAPSTPADAVPEEGVPWPLAEFDADGDGFAERLSTLHAFVGDNSERGQDPVLDTVRESLWSLMRVFAALPAGELEPGRGRAMTREAPLLKAVGDYLQAAHGLHFCTECGVFHVHDEYARHAALAKAYNDARASTEEVRVEVRRVEGEPGPRVYFAFADDPGLVLFTFPLTQQGAERLAERLRTLAAGEPERETRAPVEELRRALEACEENLRLIHEAAGPLERGSPMPKYSTFQAWKMAAEALGLATRETTEEVEHG